MIFFCYTQLNIGFELQTLISQITGSLFVFIVAYHHDRSSIREAYEEHFAPIDGREV